jgi:hypothetical protein
MILLFKECITYWITHNSFYPLFTRKYLEPKLSTKMSSPLMFVILPVMFYKINRNWYKKKLLLQTYDVILIWKVNIFFTWTSKGSLDNISRSKINILAPYAIKQSRSISPTRRPKHIRKKVMLNSTINQSLLMKVTLKVNIYEGNQSS